MLRRLTSMGNTKRTLGLTAAVIVTALPVGIAAAGPTEPSDPTTSPTTAPSDTTAPPTTTDYTTPPSDPTTTTTSTPPTSAAPDTTAIPPTTQPPPTAPPTTAAPPVTEVPTTTAPPDTPVTAAPREPSVTPAPAPATPKSSSENTVTARGRGPWARGCITHTLRPGSVSRQVKCLENRLRRLNFPITADWRYGRRTADAVAQIKRRARMPDDSIAGPDALDRIYNPHLRGTRRWGYCLTRAVRPGDSGYQVRCLSRRLKSLNYPVRVDLRYTARERNAIDALKRTIGAKTDGRAAAGTLDAIYNPNRRKAKVWGKCIVETLRPGDRGYQVECLKRRLKRLNLLGRVDGRYGARTAIAVDAMRYRAGLGQDGTAGRRALNKIFGARLPAPIQWGHDETGSQLSVVSVAGPWAPLLPSWSGTGRRIVYSRAHQRAWAVAADGHVVRSWLVSGSLYGNEVPGNHYVFSKSRYAYAYTGSGVVMPYMVRYYTTPRGNNIGFHEIPSNASGPIMSEYELGHPRSAGCTRQARLDAIFLWNWAPVGTKVVVT